LNRSVDRTAPVQRALVIHPTRPTSGDARDPDARLEEAVGLAMALDLKVDEALIVPLRASTPATLFGKGKVTELGTICEVEKLDVAVIDDALTPVQQRNLEKAWQVKVVDRTGLILEIFARRARTREGRLQVELARLAYERSRLVRTWTHLERQRGGFGFLGGPGETQIEADRRLLAERIAREYDAFTATIAEWTAVQEAKMVATRERVVEHLERVDLKAYAREIEARLRAQRRRVALLAA